MRKTLFTIGLLCCLFCLWAKTGDTKYVYVEQTALRNTASAWGKDVGFVSYGDKVTVVSEKGKWVEIQLSVKPSVRGWIPASSLTSKKILSSTNRASASAEELSLAGKGFTAEIENEYKKSAEANFDAVDIIETKGVSSQMLYNFIITGKLEGAE